MRRLLAVTALLAAAAALATPASARNFSYGVSSSEVTPTSALLWARALKAGRVQLEVALDSHFARRRISKTTFAKKADDLTVQTRVAGLIPDTRYFYFFHQGKQRSLLGTFKTAPKTTVAKAIRFAVTGDADGVRVNGQNYWNMLGSHNMATYKAMANEKNDFNVNLGDTIYSDGEADQGVPIAFTLAAKRQKYRLGLTYPNLLKLRQSGPVYNQWDDHEFIDDFTPVSQACDAGSVFNPQFACDTAAITSAGRQAFRDYMPTTYSPQNGTYRTFRWGKNVEVFILDERSFRSLRASEVKDNPAAGEPTAHVCENPAGSNQDDPAPQVPQRLRNVFSFIYPPAANPARPECLAALNDPTRSMLGKRQYDAFTSAVKNSTAKWKLVINEVPIMEQPLNPYDDWMGYNGERKKLLGYLKSNVKNVAFFTTDFHANWVNDAHITTFPEDGGEQKSGVMEFVTGGVADGTFGSEINAFAKSDSADKLLESQFLLKPPPDGTGMMCSNIRTYGYTQVTATASKLTVAMKDNTGKTIIGTPDGKACGLYVLNAR